MKIFLFGCAVGLIVGWNLFPQPQFVKNIYDWVIRKVSGWLSPG